MRDRLAFVLSAAVFLFLAEALRAFFGVLFAAFYQALSPTFRPSALLIGLVPLVALLAPAVPIFRRLQRQHVVAGAAAAAAILRVGLCLPPLLWRALFGSAVLACCALFIGAASGAFSRRIYAAGAAAGLVLDQVLRLAGRSYDVTMRPQWLPAQLAMALLIIAISLAFLTVAEPEYNTDDEESLERRTGGLRLRGSIALACILFLDGTVAGMPEAAARLTRVPYDLVGLLMVLAGAAAVVVLLASPGPVGRSRYAAVALACIATLAAAVAFNLDGWLVALLLAAGHFSLLVLLYRALAPAGGRRGGWVIAVGLTLLVLFQLFYSLTFFYAFTAQAFRDRAPTVLAAAGALLIGGLLLTPVPRLSLPRSSSRLPLMGAGIVLLALSLRLNWRAAPAPILPAVASTIRVVTYNVHYGFNSHWRYDPEALARVLESSAADIVVLQEVPAGLPVAYGTDLTLWLGRRLRMQSHFAPTINGLLGDAYLTRLPILKFDYALLPPDTADRQALGRLTVRAGRSVVTVFGTHLGIHPGDRFTQIAAAVSLMGSTVPAVFAGDLNDGSGSAVFAALRRAGFQNAFHVLGRLEPATAPAHQPRLASDHIFVRQLHVEDAQVLPTTASDHRPVLATLRVQ